MRYRFLFLIGFYFSTVQAGWTDLRINEFSAINDSAVADEYGEFDDWLELYNSGTTSINIRGLYVTDDLQKPHKWQVPDDLTIPAHAFCIIWCDNQTSQGKSHAGFGLSGTRGVIALYSSAGTLIDSVTYFKVRPDVSEGRFPDGTGRWKLFSDPTPGSSNSTKAWEGFTDPPVFDTCGGFFNSLTLKLSPAGPEDIICFTTNSDDPDTLSQKYNQPLVIGKTTVVRAIAKRAGYLPSDVVSNIYLIGKSHALPVWVTITDSSNLYGTYGIYSHPWNEGVAWERFSQHQYFVDNRLRFSVNSGIRIQGGNSVGMAKKSFRHFYESRYGTGALQYPLFTHSNLTSYKNIVMRAGYDDDITTSKGTLLRDPLSAELWKKSGGLATASEWAVLYLDTAYWGIYNLRESINDEFIQDHLGTNNIDLIRYEKEGIELKYGDTTDWHQLRVFFNTCDFSADGAYDQASALVNMDNLLNLLAFIHCSQYRSWTWGSFAYKTKEPGARWSWTLWDTDRAYEDTLWNGFTDYQDLANEKWANFMPRNLLHNGIFKVNLINRTADLLNSVFQPAKSTATFDSLVLLIKDEIPREKARWKPTANWDGNVQFMRKFLQHRPDVVRRQILQAFSLPDSCSVTLKAEGEGEIRISTLQIDRFPWKGIYFSSIPVQLEAIPKPGYKFYGWKNIPHPDRFLTAQLESDTAFTALFVEDQTVTDTGNIVINEIMYNEAANDKSGDWVELYNPGNTIDMTGWILKDDNDAHAFIFHKGTRIAPGEYLVVAYDTSSFRSAHKNVAHLTGNFGAETTGFGLSGSGDVVRLCNKYGHLVDMVNFDDNYPWPTGADGNGPSLQLIQTGYDNSLPASWTASNEIPFTPGRENLIITSVPEYGNKTEKGLSVGIYPNPLYRNGTVVISVQQETEVVLTVTDLLGRTLCSASMHLASGQNDIPLEVTGLRLNELNGIYLLKVGDGDSMVTVKFLVIKR
jgi:hypothetical protein